MRKLCLVVSISLLPLFILHAQADVPGIPAGTSVIVRTIDSIDSKTAEVGKTFRASLDAPLVLNGQEAAAKGADATLRIIEASKAGNLKGKASLTVVLVSVNAGTGILPVSNSTVTMESAGKGKKSAFKIGGGAALGAAIGGLAGGGKGAAVGAGAGAGAGAAVAMLTGPHVQIPSETVLTFKVQ